MVAPVCNVGDTLEVTCTTSEAFLRWNIFNEHGGQEKQRNINSNDISKQMSNTTVNQTSFHFSRNSAQGVSPLVSTLSIYSIPFSISGIRVQCMELGESMAEDSTLIVVTDASIRNREL